MRALALLLWLLLPLGASAQWSAPLITAGSGAAYTGVVDCAGCLGTTNLVSCYSFLACSAASLNGTTKAVQVRSTGSGTPTCDFLITTSGTFGGTASGCSAGTGVSLAAFGGVHATCTSGSATATNVIALVGCGATPSVGDTITATVTSGSLPLPVIITSVATFTGGAGNVTVQAGPANANFTVVMTTTTVTFAMFAHTIYDQSAGLKCAGTTTCDAVQATTGQQGYVVPGCFGPSNQYPCLMEFQGASANLQSATNFTPSNGVVTVSGVGNRIVGTCAAAFIAEAGVQNLMSGRNGVANRWNLLGTGAGVTNVVANDQAWHAGNGLINTTSSVLNIDGSETSTSITTGGTTAGKVGILANNGASCTQLWAEAAAWDTVVSNTTQRNAMQANQKARWGTP